MNTEEHEELADEFDRHADEMQHVNAKLAEEIDSVRKDWDAKRSDGSVPGAVPREEDLSSSSAAEEAEDGPAAGDETEAGASEDETGGDGQPRGREGAPEREPDEA